MSLENDFIPFAVGGSANVLTQSAYAALTTLTQNGFLSGIAPSIQLNKVWRQSSIMAAVIADFIVANAGQPAIDDGTTATLLANLATAVSVVARQNPVLADTGAANAYVVANAAAFTAYPTVSGLVIDVSILNANTGASTINVDGLGTKPIYGLGLQPLQGAELVAKGVASLLYVVASTVNSGNGAFVILECTGGAQQIAAATASQHAVQFGQVTGLVGDARNLSAVVSAGGASITYTASQLFVASALGGLPYSLANFNQTFNGATTGLGGMDTGALPASGYVAFYAALTAAGAQGIFGTLANSLVGETYGGTHLPAGVIATALIGVWPTNPSSLLTIGAQRGRRHSSPAGSALNSSVVNPSLVSLSISSLAPPNARTVGGYLTVQNATASTMSILVAADVNGTGLQNNGENTGNGSGSSFELDLITAQTMYWASSNQTGTPLYTINLSSYSF